MNILLANPSPIPPSSESQSRPRNLVDSGQYNDGTQDWWLYLCTDDVSSQYPDSKLIGTWSRDGDLLTVLDSDYEAFIRPFGNDQGVATDSLDYHHYLGHPQREVQETPVPETAAQYPADTQPIVLTMARRFDDTPGFEGQGWIATIEFSDPNRPPNARAIGIYTDPQHQNFLYTTGAFVFTDQGDGTFKWQTVNPPGRVTQTPETIYYALLFGSLQEGRMTIDPEQSARTDFFWEKNQDGSAGQVNAQWFDTGATVTGMAGTATLVSDTSPFSIGDQVRIEGVEMAVIAITPGQWLALDPYRVSSMGAVIEKFGTP